MQRSRTIHRVFRSDSDSNTSALSLVNIVILAEIWVQLVDSDWRHANTIRQEGQSEEGDFWFFFVTDDQEACTEQTRLRSAVLACLYVQQPSSCRDGDINAPVFNQLPCSSHRPLLYSRCKTIIVLRQFPFHTTSLSYHLPRVPNFQHLNTMSYASATSMNSSSSANSIVTVQVTETRRKSLFHAIFSRSNRSRCSTFTRTGLIVGRRIIQDRVHHTP